MKALIIFTLFTSLFATITYLDLKQDYLNVNYAQSYTLTFILSNGLNANQYIKVILPIQLDSSNGMSAGWSTDILSDYPTYNPTKIARSTITSELSMYSYFITLYTSGGSMATLQPGVAYRLKLTSSTVYSGSVGFKNNIQIYVTTSTTKDHIIIDSNPSFGSLYFVAAPATSTAISVTTAGTFVASTSVDHQVQFTPAVTISNNHRLEFRLSNKQFQFQATTCTSLNTNSYTCMILDGQKVVYQIAASLPASTAISFIVRITGPPLPGSSDLAVLTIEDFNSIVDEVATASGSVATIAHVWAAVKYSSYYAWGFNTFLSFTIPSCITIFAKNTEQHYNRIKFAFTIDSNLPLTDFKVQVDMSSADSIIRASIMDNLPSYSGGSVICNVISTPVTGIACSNVGTLVLGTTYYIAARFTFPSSVTGFPANFGKISIFAYDSTTGTYATSSIVSPARSPFTIPIKTNLDKQYNSEPPMRSWPATSSQAVSGAGLKLGNASRIQFHVDTVTADFDNSGSFSSNTAGLEIYTSGTVVPITSAPSACASSDSSINSGDIYYMADNQVYDTLNTARFRVSFNTKNFLGFGTYAPFTYTFANAPIITAASYFADDNLVDVFFATFTSGIQGSTTTFLSGEYKCFMMNGYVVSEPGSWPSGSLSLTLSNFWTSTGSLYLTGREFPAFFRIKGTLNSADYTGTTSKLILFFTNVDPFPGANYSSNNQVSCSGSTAVTCYYFDGITHANYQFQSRLEIYMTFSTSPFQILIPIATRANQLVISATLGTATSYSSLTTKYNLGIMEKALLFSFDFSSLSATTTSLTLVDNPNLYNENYLLVTTDKYVGSVSSGTINAYHLDGTGSGFQPNSGIDQSAMYSWTTVYNFFQAASTATSTFVGSDVCIYYQYYIAADTTYSDRYGVACPVNVNIDTLKTISIPQFTYPTVEGYDVPSTYTALSNKKGVLTNFVRDTRSTALTPNNISSVTLGPVLYQGESAVIVTVSFVTTNLLPRNSYVQLTTTATVPWQISFSNGAFCALYQGSIPDLSSTALPGNCLQTFNNYTLTFQITSTTDWTMNQLYLVIYGITVSNPITISNQNFWIATYTSKFSVIDNSTIYAARYLTQPRPSDISIKSISFLADTIDTKTYIQATLKTSATKLFSRFDRLTLSFWDVPQSIDTSFVCQAFDEGLTTTYFLKECIVNLPYVSLTTNFDLLTVKTFTLYLKSFKNPLTKAIISYYMWDYAGLYVYNATETYTYPQIFTASASFTELLMLKRFNSYWTSPEFIFTLRIPADITQSTAFIIRFPSVYSAADANLPLLCLINDLETNCYLSNPQEITITDPPVSYPANRQFRLSILGLRQPYAATAYNIAIIVTGKLSLNKVYYYQEIIDSLPQAASTISSLKVTSLSFNSIYALEIATITMGLRLGAASGNSLASRSLVIEFPQRFGLVLHNTTIGYTFSLSGSALKSGTSKIRLNRLEIPLIGVTLQSSGQTYSLVLTNFPTPFLEIISHAFESVYISASDNTTIEYQANRVLINYPNMIEYEYNPNTFGLKISSVLNGAYTASSYTSPFKVYAGLPSQQFVVQVAGGTRFDRQIIFTPTMNFVSFDTNPAVVNISSGLLEYEFSVTFPLLAAPGFYNLRFDRTELDPARDSNTNFYTIVPPLLIQLISQQNVISVPKFSDNTLELPQNGYSFPIVFDLSLLKPPKELIIIAYIPATSEIEIDFQDYSQITLTPTNPIGSFTLIYKSGGTPFVTTTSIAFYLAGEDQNLYALDLDSINIALTSLSNNLPNVNVTFDNTKLNQTGFQVNVSCDQVSQLYYNVLGYYGSTSNFAEIFETRNKDNDLSYVKEMVRLRTTYQDDQFTRQDQFFGVWNYQDINTPTGFSFNGLRSGTYYSLRIWAVNLIGNSSTLYEYNFTTLTNSGQKLKVLITFDSVLENRQLNKIACWFAVTYRIPLDNVLDFQGFSCNNHRVTNAVQNVDNILSSQYRILQGTSSGSYIYAFYIYPLAFYSSDNVRTRIVADITANTFISSLNSFLATWPYFIPTISAVTYESVTTSPVYFIDSSSNPTTDFTVTYTNTTVTVSSLALNQKGFVWIYALKKSDLASNLSTLYLPGRNDFRFYINRRLKDENYIGMRYYDGTTRVSLYFQGLKPNTDYYLYIMGQNDDSGSENLTSLIYTEYVRTSYGERGIKFIWMIIIGIVMYASLIM